MPEDGSDKPQPAGRPLSLKIDDDVQGGAYANRLIVAHGRSEFVLDFVADFPPGPRVVARIVTTPDHLRSFIDALSKNLEQWSAHQRPGGDLPGRPPVDA